jgi:GNAT superfamily N-acetyltransferase
MTIRTATLEEAGDVSRLIVQAYRVEDFFVYGDRTSVDEVRALMAQGQFLVLDDPPGSLAGTVYVAIEDGRGFFAMLSVDPARQRRGLGARLVAAVEDHCRSAGCHHVDLHVVNLRTELPPFYRALGYVEHGTAPFPDDKPTKIPCHVICMSKPL